MHGLLVRDVMTPTVVTISPELGYKQIVDLLIEFGVSAVPVVDGDRQVLGVVSEAICCTRSSSTVATSTPGSSNGAGHGRRSRRRPATPPRR